MTGTADGYSFSHGFANDAGEVYLEVFAGDRKISEMVCHIGRVGEAFDTIADTHRRFVRRVS